MTDQKKNGSSSSTQLLRTQDGRSLEDHTSEFLVLAYQTHYLDSALISFYYAGLNEQLKNKIPFYGPWGRFVDLVGLVLSKSGSSFTVGEMEDYVVSHSHTMDPEHEPHGLMYGLPKKFYMNLYRPTRDVGLCWALKSGALCASKSSLMKSFQVELVYSTNK